MRRRVGADLTVAFDLDGKIIATGEGTRTIDAGLSKALMEQGEHSPDAPRFVVSGSDIYQVFMAVGARARRDRPRCAGLHRRRHAGQ